MDQLENQKPVRIAFIGSGGMGQMAHLRQYASLPECRVVALAEPRAELARAVAARYNIPRIYPDAEALLAEEQVDGLVASQPFNRHGQIVLPLYRHGIPVFTEKPIAASIEVAEHMVSALEAGGSWHMVGYHKRSDPAVMWAKAEMQRLKESGELGALRYVRITMPPGDWMANGFTEMLTSDEVPPASDPDPAANDMDAADFQEYSSFVNFYIHQVNLLRYLLGENYRVAYADPSGVLLAAESESGVCGTIEMRPFATTRDWQESALVGFERGYFNIELPAPVTLNRAGRVTLFSDPGNGAEPRDISPVLPPVSAMRQQAINFVRAIRGEIAPMCEAAEALEDLKVAREYLRLWKGV
jgi:predicted dehydrogenase